MPPKTSNSRRAGKSKQVDGAVAVAAAGEPKRARKPTITEAEKKSAKAQLEAIDTAKKSPKCIVITEEWFLESVKNSLHLAWWFQSSESHLYPLHNLLQSLPAFTMHNPSSTRSTVLPWPQPLFGMDIPSNADSGISSLAGKRIPDEARVFLHRKGQGTARNVGFRHSVLDFLESKALNVKQPWLSPVAEAHASSVAKRSFCQVHEEAMSLFRKERDTHTVSGTLAVGIYYTMLRWDARPDDKELLPMPSMSPSFLDSSGNVDLSSPIAIAGCLQALDSQIAFLNARPLPTVLCFNQPMFLSANPLRHNWIETISLNPAYTSASHESLLKVCPPGMEQQPSWFDVKPKKAPEVNDEGQPHEDVAAQDGDLESDATGTKVYAQAVKSDLVEDCEEQMKALIEHWQGHFSNSLSPPNSMSSTHSDFAETHHLPRTTENPLPSAVTRSHDPQALVEHDRVQKELNDAHAAIADFAKRFKRRLLAEDDDDLESFVDGFLRNA